MTDEGKKLAQEFGTMLRASIVVRLARESGIDPERVVQIINGEVGATLNEASDLCQAVGVELRFITSTEPAPKREDEGQDCQEAPHASSR